MARLGPWKEISMKFVSWLRNRIVSPNRPPQGRARRWRGLQLYLEQLEEREVPALLTGGTLVQFDAAGTHALASGIHSAGVALTPLGEVLEVVTTDGKLIQVDAFGAHFLGGGVLSADVAFGPTGEVLVVTFASPAAVADLQMAKAGPGSGIAGNQITYTLTITNNGPSDAQGVSLTDTLPAGETFVSQNQANGAIFTKSNNGNAITDTISTLAAGASATFTFVATVNANVANNT